jgi:hypothetical protein
MKKKILILITAYIVLVIFSSHGFSRNEIVFDRKKIKNLFIQNPLRGPQFDPNTGKIYGLTFSGNTGQIAALDIKTGKIKNLFKLADPGKLTQGAATLDSKNQRYFFTSSIKGNRYLSIVNIRSSRVISRYKLNGLFTFITYHQPTDRIYGLNKEENSYYFIFFDLRTGGKKVVSKLPNLTHLKGTSRKIDLISNSLLFEGTNNGRNSLLSINLLSGKLEELNFYKVGVNEYRVFHNGSNLKKNKLFSFGVGNCVALAGYDKNRNIGVLAHFSSRFKKLKSTLISIEKEIKSKGGKGLKTMELFVVGGRIENTSSFKNSIMVYQILAETFSINHIGNKTYHMGMVYNIIINNGQIDIF